MRGGVPHITPMTRTCIIGDVHGMTDLLVELVGLLDLSADDTLVSLGDLVDKGPDPIGSVRFLGSLAREAPFQTVLVQANHEDKHLRYHRNLFERPKVAQEMAERSSALAELHAQLNAEDRAFLSSAVLFWPVREHGVLCVHGGIPGNLENFPETLEAAAKLPKKQSAFLRQILRTRLIDPEDGHFVSLGKEKESDVFWADVYDGRFGHVVFGHQPFFQGPAEFQHATGIDTGAVDGGSLTALILHKDGRREFISVPSRFHDRLSTRANRPLR